MGSISKPLTALAVLQMVEDEDIEAALEEPIVSYLPFLRPSWGQATLSDLLSNTSGIRKDPDQEIEPLTDDDLQEWFRDGGDHRGSHPRYAYFTYWQSTTETSFAWRSSPG